MRTLFAFLAKNTHWLLFVLLVVLSIVLIVKNNDFQQSKYVAIENDIVGTVYSATHSITSYIRLKAINEDLLENTARLESRIQYLENQIGIMKDSTIAKEIINRIDVDSFYLYNFTMAKVVNNNIAKFDNLITLNKGATDGIVPGMGVFSGGGVVGAVMIVSEHYSVAMSVLNSKSRLSCKIKNSNYFGSLRWNGESIRYAYLEELPGHAIFQTGDTIVTSDYSSLFPEGILVGTIVGQQPKGDLTSLKILLSTDFGALNDVLIVNRKNNEEQQQLETKAENYGH